jgi:2-amino-4-hydroxy-6-hydroxymethyldihydropteridine diphosphokinase
MTLIMFFEFVIGLTDVYVAGRITKEVQAAYGFVALETSRSPADLKSHVLRRIEEELGRTPSADKFAARPIDLDLIWYDNVVVTGPDLTLPDPLIPERAFLVVPLCEIAPDLVFPNSGASIRDVAAAMLAHDMDPLKDYTELLRREFGYEHERPDE